MRTLIALLVLSASVSADQQQWCYKPGRIKTTANIDPQLVSRLWDQIEAGTVFIYEATPEHARAFAVRYTEDLVIGTRPATLESIHFISPDWENPRVAEFDHITPGVPINLCGNQYQWNRGWAKVEYHDTNEVQTGYWITYNSNHTETIVGTQIRAVPEPSSGSLFGMALMFYRLFTATPKVTSTPLVSRDLVLS